MINRNSILLSIFVVTFSAFVVTGLAINPVLIDDTDAERKKPNNGH